MIVDDEKRIVSLYSSILSSAGHQIKQVANDGLEALEALKKDEDVDIIIMDQKMPRMDGLEASDKIKEIKPGVKIIMISAYEIPRTNRGMFNLILEKPVSKNQLLEAIRNA
ncbi:MAG: response regulator [Nitrososphaerales archaeon]